MKVVTSQQAMGRTSHRKQVRISRLWQGGRPNRSATLTNTDPHPHSHPNPHPHPHPDTHKHNTPQHSHTTTRKQGNNTTLTDRFVSGRSHGAAREGTILRAQIQAVRRRRTRDGRLVRAHLHNLDCSGGFEFCMQISFRPSDGSPSRQGSRAPQTTNSPNPK